MRGKSIRFVHEIWNDETQAMATEEPAIRDFIATWLAATRAHDHATVLRLVADDVVFLAPGGPPMRKAAFAAAQGGLADYDIDARADIQEIRVHGDFAWTWTMLTVVMTPKSGETPTRRTGPALTILRKDAAGWVIVRDANMLMLASK